MEESKLNWRRWLSDGDKYLKAGTPKGAKSKFGTEIRYNLLSMSFEGYCMAILDFKQNLPDNHTYTDLIFGLERVMSIDQDLKARLLKFENIQSICSIEKFHIASPSEEELAELTLAIHEIRSLAYETCLSVAY